MIESCEENSVSEEDYYDLGRAGLGSCLLGGLPAWLIAYSARLVCIYYSLIIVDFFGYILCGLFLLNIWLLGQVRFINFERTKLPEEFLKHNLEEKRKYFLDICLEVEKSDAEVQVNQFIQF